MFSGIVESLGTLISLQKEKGNLHLTISSSFTNELKIDQSIAHNGACLTVVDIKDDCYTVTAIEETLKKTNLSSLSVGDKINLERCLKVSDRIDGHIVQGHIDQTGRCISKKEVNGSWEYTFEYDLSQNNPPAGRTGITVEKGSVCVNGVSLTVVNSKENTFSVCIIPYTYNNTNFKNIEEGSTVNIEFDILGKYVAKMMNR